MKHRYENQIVASHWTSKARFSVERRDFGGFYMFFLHVDGRDIDAPLAVLSLVVEHLAEGQFDKELGFAAGPLKIPTDVRQWNNLG